MFKFTTLIFLTAQVALVLGIMTKGDLPESMQNCLDNVLIPAFQHLQEGDQKCMIPNNDAECRRNIGGGVRTDDDNSKCQDGLRELPPIDYTFAEAYLTNEYLKIMKVDLSSELPENMRDCIDTIKPISQAYFQTAKYCETLIVYLGTPDPDPYKECMEKVENVLTHPQAMKCREMSETLSKKQQLFVDPYAFKVIFDL